MFDECAQAWHFRCEQFEHVFIFYLVFIIFPSFVIKISSSILIKIIFTYKISLHFAIKKISIPNIDLTVECNGILGNFNLISCCVVFFFNQQPRHIYKCITEFREILLTVRQLCERQKENSKRTFQCCCRLFQCVCAPTLFNIEFLLTQLNSSVSTATPHKHTHIQNMFFQHFFLCQTDNFLGDFTNQ